MSTTYYIWILLFLGHSLRTCESSNTPFMIKHKSGGMFVHPLDGGNPNPSDNHQLVLHEGYHSNTIFEFDVVDKQWGYIRHVSSGKFIHPRGGHLKPGRDTDIVLHKGHHAGTLFALDQVNDWIIHKGGSYVHPHDGSPNPSSKTRLVLHDETHDAMKFILVSPSDPTKEVLPYGQPTVSGSWKIINAVLNPVAEHTHTMEYTVGKSRTESTTSEFKFAWEYSVSANVAFLSASQSISLSAMISKTSSSTWSEAKKVTREIKVLPGESVVTWQYVFSGAQQGHKAIFGSNIIADTNSPDVVPENFVGQPQ